MSRRDQRRLRVFLVGTEFFRSYGGIQSINRLLVRAFREMGRRTPLELDVFSFTDGPEHFPSGDWGDSVVRWHGASRRRGEMALQLAKRLPVARPDLVLFTHVSLLPLEEAVRMLARGARVAVLAHGTEVWEPLAGRIARVLPRVHAFVCPSEFTARKLVDVQGIAPERIAVIPHGLDPDWTAGSDASPVVQDAPPARNGRLLLSVTRLSRADREGKGIELVLRALPAVL
ncbi:MAG TPA: glycosyltransferase family 4 protein, partial [Candidatus Acidoferrales bacterium]|nr:glycosyltransferase family 4 protein [Candidatus Acidoferrales bacterium]